MPSGSFVAGSPATEPGRGRYSEEQRAVTLTHAFLMGQHEVTQAEWSAMGFPNLAGSIQYEDGEKDCTDPSCPATTMTWAEAVSFANARSKAEGFETCIELLDCSGSVGIDFECRDLRQTTASYYDCRGYRLPTFSEFQYAHRAGTTTAFYSGEFPSGTTSAANDGCMEIPHLIESAWYCANAEKTTHPVMQKKANPWGLHDLMGNVAEFVASEPEYVTVAGEPQTDPHARLPGSRRFGAVGGVAFFTQKLMRAASIGLETALSDPRSAGAGPGVGFRLVRTLTPSEAAGW